MRNVRFILQLLLGFVLILIAVYSPLNEDGRVAVGTAGFIVMFLTIIQDVLINGRVAELA